MQGLINKINKSIVAPLPSSYTGALYAFIILLIFETFCFTGRSKGLPFHYFIVLACSRGLIRSMLRKSPEHRPSVCIYRELLQCTDVI